MSIDQKLTEVFAAFDKAEGERQKFPEAWTTFRNSVLLTALQSVFQACEAKFGTGSVLLAENTGDNRSAPEDRRIQFERPLWLSIYFAPEAVSARVAVMTVYRIQSGQEWVIERFRLDELTLGRIEALIATALRDQLLKAGMIDEP